MVERLIANAQSMAERFDNPGFLDFFTFAVDQLANHGNSAYFDFIKRLKQPPVDIETFLDSDQFFGSTDLEIWPLVREYTILLNKYWWKGVAHGAKSEFLAMGATGTGKSEIAKITLAYHLHILGCMSKPQGYWGIPSATSILFPIFAAKPKVTKNVLYMPLRAYIESMPWFQANMRFDPYVESEMIFKEQNIRVVPVGADVDAILGEAIPGGIIDEINFMQVVEQSRKNEAKTGRASRYDQASDIYNRITRRKTSRFTRPGPNVGVICPLSSTSHPGEFTEKRLEEIRDNNYTHVVVYDKAQYEAQGHRKNYSGDVFHVIIHGDAASTIELKEQHEPIPKDARVYEVPVELRKDFERDAEGSVRDIIGKSVRSLDPFMAQRSHIQKCFDLWIQLSPPLIVPDPNCFSYFGLPEVLPDDYCRNITLPRYVHIDLSHTSDRCGIAMVRFDGMCEVERKDDFELLPSCTVELAMSIEPNAGEGVDLANVRKWVSRLKTKYQYPIKVVSYDGWNSLESRQEWKKQGMMTVVTSVDKTTAPYEALREAIYDQRIALYPNEVLQSELNELEHDRAKKKVDHPPNGSKDVSDAVCGAYYVMLTRASTWRGSPMDRAGTSAADRFGGDRKSLGARR